MPNWVKKSLVVLITIVTFGLVTPAQLPFIETGSANGNKTPNRDVVTETAISPVQENQDQDPFLAEDDIDKDDILSEIYKQAESQSYLKFGSKIKPIIHDEFKDIILPKMESVIEDVLEDYPENQLRYLAVSELPGSGNTERIFHIIDMKNNQDIIRFHVRKDHPPQAGYWYNFHYHTYHDHFETHHELGSIYWGKNTPPNWMS